jgi:soluble lytic murein transglycosylase
MTRLKRFVLFAVIISVAVAVTNVILKKLYPSEYMDIVKENAEKHQLDPLLVLSVIRAESQFCERATSHKNAKGLMQMKVDTALWCAQHSGDTLFTEDKLYEPETSIRLGVWYLKYLLDQFNGDYKLCLAAYNAGIGNVRKWLENSDYSGNGSNLDKIPFPETERYVKKVFNNYTVYKMLYGL